MVKPMTVALPDTTVSVREVFGIDSDIRVPAYSKGDAYVPDLDTDYLFDREYFESGFRTAGRTGRAGASMIF